MRLDPAYDVAGDHQGVVGVGHLEDVAAAVPRGRGRRRAPTRCRRRCHRPAAGAPRWRRSPRRSTPPAAAASARPRRGRARRPAARRTSRATWRRGPRVRCRGLPLDLIPHPGRRSARPSRTPAGPTRPVAPTSRAGAERSRRRTQRRGRRTPRPGTTTPSDRLSLRLEAGGDHARDLHHGTLPRRRVGRSAQLPWWFVRLSGHYGILWGETTSQSSVGRPPEGPVGAPVGQDDPSRPKRGQGRA